MNKLVITFTCVLAAACNGQQEFTVPLTLGGQVVDAATLNAGREAFMLYCFACHGESGRGDGPSSPGLRPPPRDFTQGVFKFGGVKTGELPTDEALLKTIRQGLHGTPMLPWDTLDVERRAIVQYLKTLSPRWQKEKPGQAIDVTADPWNGKEPAAIAIEEGRIVYHAIAQCKGCHPAYATKQEMADMNIKVGLPAPTEFPKDADLYRPTLRESQYQVGETKIQILPIDFLVHPVKSARVGPAGVRLEDLYRTIAAGIGGTAMPVWKGALPEDKLWALVHYVKSLVDMRNTPAASALRERLESQALYVPPAPPPVVEPE